MNEVKITLNGAEYTMVFTLGTFRRLKKSTGVDFFATNGQMDPSLFPDLIAASLVGVTLTGDEVADMISIGEMDKVVNAVNEAFGQSPNAPGAAV